MRTGLHIFGRILSPLTGADAAGIHHRHVQQVRSGVAMKCFHVIGGSKTDSFAGLPHQIHEEGFQGAAAPDRLRDPLDQHVRDQTGEQGAWTEGNEIGLRDGFQCFGKRLAPAGPQADASDSGAAFTDLGFTSYDAAVFEFSFQRDVAGRGRINSADACQDFRRNLDGLRKVASDVGQRAQEEVAEAVAF